MSMEQLTAFLRETEALAQVAGRTGWDQETMMPDGAAPQRAEEMAALEGVLHARRTDPRLGDWLANADPQTDKDRVILRHVQRSYDRHTRVPADLARQIARETSAAQRIWAKARAEDDYDGFAPTLARVTDLRRQEAAAMSGGQGDPYDALLQDYEPGMNSARLSQLFGAMRPRIVALREAVLDRPAPPALSGDFAPAAQMDLARRLAQIFGYDFNHGHLAQAVHPFCSGSGLDVRITTRVDPADPLNCLYSVIHETGHACYEQGVDRDYLLTPLGAGVSMGVHESQSRIYENQLARSRGFAEHLYGLMRDAFGPLSVTGPEDLWRAVNRVERGFIRTEAEELSYNLHVFLRFDLEQDLIRGTLDPRDLEEAWNARFKSDFGQDVPRASLGVLQDVHWPVGLMGYFPTYALGNVYAGCLFAALQAARPDLDAELARGDLTGATGWLRDHVQRHGGLFEAEDLIARATGTTPSPEPLLTYLEQKFSALYRL